MAICWWCQRGINIEKKIRIGIIGILWLLGTIVIVIGAFSMFNGNNTPKIEVIETPIPKPNIQVNLPDMSPKIEFVSGTEYNFFDNSGSTIIKLADYKGNFINTSCYETILYPNKSVYLDWALMNPQSAFQNYYLDWIVPKTAEGNYDQEVSCLIGNKNITLGKAFHLSESNLTREILNGAYMQDVSN